MKNFKYLIVLLFIYADVFFCVTGISIPLKTEKETLSPYCESVKFVLSSDFTKSCFHKSIEGKGQKLEDTKPETILCLGLVDLSMKWCSKGSRDLKLPVLNATQFDSHISKDLSLHKVKKFCETPKTLTMLNKTSLIAFYNDSFTCYQYCLDPSEDNQKPRKVCSALAWIQDTINLVPEKQEPKPVIEDEIPVKNSEAQSTQKKNSPEKIIDETKNIASETDLATAKKNESQSAKLKTQANIPITPNVSNTLVKNRPKELLSANPANTLNVSKEQKTSDIKDTNKNKQTISEIKQNSIPDNAVNQKENSPSKNLAVDPVNKSEDVLPDKAEKKIEASPEKEQKQKNTKSSTLSENTNDIEIQDPHIENIGAPPINDNEEVQADDIDLPNQEPEFALGRKMIPHFPGKEEEEETHIFSYFVAFSLLFICCYIGYLNKKKILAMLLEGRRSRGSRERRRPSTANYRKLDCNLEEAVTSQCNSNVTHVIY